MPVFLSKIIILQGNQLERLLVIDVIAQQRPFFNRNFGGLKGKQRICSNIFVSSKSLQHINTYLYTAYLLDRQISCSEMVLNLQSHRCRVNDRVSYLFDRNTGIYSVSTFFNSLVIRSMSSCI